MATGRLHFMDLNDLWASVGLALLAVGLYMAWPPLAFIVVGLVFLVAGLYGAAVQANDGGESE